MRIEVGSRSDIGRARKINEDSLGMYRPAEAQERARKGELFLVADGMGGHVSGEVASRLAVESVLRSFAAGPGGDVKAELEAAVQQANAEVYARGGGASTGDQPQGPARMGTTLVGALMRGNELHVVNVGDSRAYRLRNGRLEQLSRDHSLVAAQVEKGLIDAEQARHLVYRNTLTRALGQGPTAEVDYFPHTLQPGDVIVLCTDGLCGQVTDAEITATVSRCASRPDEAAAHLVDLANQHGGPDNISVIVARAVPDTPSEPAMAPAPRAATAPAWKKYLGFWPCALVAAAALLLVALMAIVLLMIKIRTGASGLLPPAPGMVAPVATVAGVNLLPTARVPSSSTPVVRPIEIQLPILIMQLDGLAVELGYENAADMINQNPREGKISRVMPRPPGVLIVGPMRRLVKGPDSTCEFQVMVGGQSYTVTCLPGGRLDVAIPVREGDLVRVLGLSESENNGRAVIVDIRPSRPGGSNAEWVNWFTDSGMDRRLWIYTVASKDTTGDLAQYGVQDGDRVLVYAQWETDRAQIVKNIRRGKLDGDHYTLIP